VTSYNVHKNDHLKPSSEELKPYLDEVVQEQELVAGGPGGREADPHVHPRSPLAFPDPLHDPAYVYRIYRV
jgi:hypothetical protein